MDTITIYLLSVENNFHIQSKYWFLLVLVAQPHLAPGAETRLLSQVPYIQNCHVGQTPNMDTTCSLCIREHKVLCILSSCQASRFTALINAVCKPNRHDRIREEIDRVMVFIRKRTGNVLDNVHRPVVQANEVLFVLPRSDFDD